MLGSLDSDEKRPIVTTSSNAAFAEPGYLFFMRENALVAQRFDSRNYVLKEEPHMVTDDVQYFPRLGFALFAVSGNRTVITQTGRRAAKSQLTWFDRNGKTIGTVGPVGLLESPSLSPDGKRVAVGQTDPDVRSVSIWIYQLANNAVTRFTFGPHFNNLAGWSPDGKRIVFSSESDRKLRFTLYQKNSDGSGSEEELADLGTPQEGLWDWSRDGKYLLAMRNSEVWYVSLPDRQSRPFLQAKWIVRNAQFSPDGRWVAYSTNETGNWEVYVSPFPTANGRWQVSRGVGQEPRWRRDGKELFYLSADGTIIAVPVKTGSNFEAGPPVTLFQSHVYQQSSAFDVFSYDVTADGQKFLINKTVDEPNAAPLSIILNWASEIEK